MARSLLQHVATRLAPTQEDFRQTATKIFAPGLAGQRRVIRSSGPAYQRPQQEQGVEWAGVKQGIALIAQGALSIASGLEVLDECLPGVCVPGRDDPGLRR